MGWLLRRFFRLWVRAAVQPAEAPPALTAPRAPVCYVLERDSVADLAVLCNVDQQGGVAVSRETLEQPAGRRAPLVLRRRPAGAASGTPPSTRRPPPYLLALVEALRADSVRDILLVPTAVYWGRAPQKEGSWLRLLFAENWALTTRARKFFAVLVNGRNVMVEMGEPDQPALAARRLAGATTRRGASRASCAASCAGSAPSASVRIFRIAARSWRRCCARAPCAPWSLPMRARNTASYRPGPAAGAQVRLRDRR